VAGQLSCVNLEDGKLLWTKNLNDEYRVIQNFFGVASTPYVFQDLLLVMVGGSPEDSLRVPPGRLNYVKPNGSAIVAFDKKTGKEKYRLGDDLASYVSMTVRNIEGKATGLAFLRSGLIAFDPSSGKQLFEFPWRAESLESVNAALPVTRGDEILLSETYEIGSVLLRVQDGTPEVIRKDEGSYRELSFRAHWSTPVLVDGFLYGCSGRNRPDCDFRCVRWSDGEVQWTVRKHERSSVLVADGYLIVLGEHGNLELVRPTPEKLDVVAQVDLGSIADPSDGKALLTYPCWAAPILSHGDLYLRGKDRLLCMELIPKDAR
ncbi:MAG: PQQ-binding-like beta-propeller repeat protein, partial [Planctomycetota bacterium]